MVKIYIASNGSHYIKLANGQCRFISMNQIGGGKCSLCHAPNSTKARCPCNPKNKGKKNLHPLGPKKCLSPKTKKSIKLNTKKRKSPGSKQKKGSRQGSRPQRPRPQRPRPQRPRNCRDLVSGSGYGRNEIELPPCPPWQEHRSAAGRLVSTRSELGQQEIARRREFGPNECNNPC